MKLEDCITVSLLLSFQLLSKSTGVTGCVDSNLRFKLRGKLRGCNWVRKKKTLKRCSLGQGTVATHCPLACGLCESKACVDATRRFRIDEIGTFKTCWWVAKEDTPSRCAMDGVRNTCRATCPNDSCGPPVRPPLRFRRVVNSQGRNVLKFKILQLADLHYGENSWTDWGPDQDRRSSIAIQSYIRNESPDLVILSGDQLTSKNIDANATSYHSKIINAMLDVQPDIKWATVFGNHDDEMYRRTFDDGRVVEHDAKTSRKDLVTLDMTYAGSRTLQGNAPDYVFGTSNYVLSIQSDTNENVLLNMYLFDSGGGKIAQVNHQSQVIWFRAKQIEMPNIPAVAFQHIPTSDNAFAYKGNICGGPSGEGVSPVETDSGLLQALKEDGNVHFMSVGHNHGNDYCCPANGGSTMSLCFGRHSGHGGYSTYRDGVKWGKGARIYVLEYDENKFGWSSYVRLENGNIENWYQP